MVLNNDNSLNNPLIAEYIGPYYVYLLVDPGTDEVFIRWQRHRLALQRPLKR